MAKRVVVTGLGVICPVGLDRASSWEALMEGRSGVDYIKSFDTDGLETRIAAEVVGFDPAAALGRKESRRIDRYAQFACVAALEAMEHAGLNMAKEDPGRIAVLVGSGIGGIQTLSEQMTVFNDRGARRVSPFLIPMMLPDMGSAQVSMTVGAKGLNFAPVSACSTGADAIGEAFEVIRRGTADAAFAGGAEAAICPIGVAGFNAMTAISTRNDDPQGASRPFDAERDGFVLGEGAGILFLESLEHAESRGAEPLAEVVGYGATSDAHHITQPGPGGEGAARAMKIALDLAGLTTADIDYVNAHGTSTPLNDRAETQALKKAFGEDVGRIAISSTKSMTGHLLGAAGGIESMFSVMAIVNSALPPTINYQNPDPDCDLDYVPNKARRQPVTTAMSNSLGFGGHNTSLVFRKFEA